MQLFRTLQYGALWMAASVGCGYPRVIDCMDIAVQCNDQLSITVHRPDWAPPRFATELEVDEQHIACPAVPEPEPVSKGLRQAQAVCSDGSSTWVTEQLDCHEEQFKDIRTQTCALSGRFVQTFLIRGLPKRATLNLRDRLFRAERLFEPAYVEQHPRGVGCEPSCLQAQADWELP